MLSATPYPKKREDQSSAPAGAPSDQVAAQAPSAPAPAPVEEEAHGIDKLRERGMLLDMPNPQDIQPAMPDFSQYEDAPFVSAFIRGYLEVKRNG